MRVSQPAFDTQTSADAAPVYQWFVGIDWGSQTHQVSVLDQARQRVGERVVDHDGTSVAHLAAWLTTLAAGQPSQVAVALELPRGAVVETLVEQGFPVFAINPKQLDRFRDRHTVAGAKDDRRDAFVLADALRTDLPAFRRVLLDAPEFLMIRELSRTEEALQTECRRATNRLRDQLHRFYPQMLQLCPAADEAWLWALLDLVPTPAHAALVTPAKVQRLLKIYRIRRVTAAEVVALLQTPALQVAPGAAEAASAHIALLLPCIRVLTEQLKRCATHVETLLATLAAPASALPGPSDITIIQSLPGAGRKMTAWLLAEAAQPLAARDYRVLRTQGGVAPVTRQSGKRRQVLMRYGCNQRLRNALFHMARVAVKNDSIFRQSYATARAKGHSHGRTLRGIADRLLQLLMAMLRDRTLYDPTRVRGALTAPTPR
jgi:transposase